MKTEYKPITKAFLLLFLFALIHFNLLAQGESEQKNGNNELKINTGSLLLEFPEVSYENILNDESAIGISLAFPLDNEISYRFIVYPNYRIYFGNKRAAGFFIEGNSAIFSQRLQRDTFIGSVNADSNANKMGLGLGLAVGGKFLTKSGFIGELYIGGGRNFINTDKIDEGYPRVGISIGKRF